jgi:ribose 5-phosphate isomerase B
MGARLVRPSLAREIVDAWLNTKFEGGRHQQRLDKITQLEAGPEKSGAAG